MKEIIRGYHIFLPKGWKRAVIYMAFPFLVMGICIVAGLNLAELNLPVFVLLFAGTSTLWADGIIYFLIFGGFADKDSKHMEYIKSSSRGSGLFHRALVADAVRRICSISLIFLAAFITVSASLDIQMGIFLAGVFSITCLVAFVTSFVLGFLQNILWAFLVLGILNMIYGGATMLFLVAASSGMHVGLLVLIILLVCGFTFLVIREHIAFLVRRMKGWYYDF